MVVGKPDININSYGIQYKEKRVNYTNKKRLTVTTEAEEERENTMWGKMNRVQSNNSKKRPNAAQAVGSAPTKTKPFTEMIDGKQQDKKDQNEPDKFSHTTQQATSSPPTKGHEDESSTIDKIPHAARTGAGEIVDLHSGKGKKQSQGKGLSTISTQEGGTTHLGMKPTIPKRGGGGGGGDQRDDLLARELRQKHPTTPEGYTPPTKKEIKDIKTGKDPKGLRGQEGEKYTSQRLASIKSSTEKTIFKANLLKLDLMKDLNTKNSKTSIPTMPSSESQEFQEQSTTARMGKIYDDTDYEDTPKTGSSPKGTGASLQTSDTWQGGQEDSEYRKITNPLYTNDGKGRYDVQPAPRGKRGAPKVDPRNRKRDPIKTLPKTASETILKSILLKLDLTKTFK